MAGGGGAGCRRLTDHRENRRRATGYRDGKTRTLGDFSGWQTALPTAGLDPAERRRFHNLLARIGEEVVVILSTHIVEDVSDLCTRMAVMADGRILVEDEPGVLLGRLANRLWRRVVDHDQVAGLRERMPVVSTRMSAGKTEVRVIGETAPDADMQATEPSMEDVYFATLQQHGFAAELD